jgi:outer membrane protein TolC
MMRLKFAHQYGLLALLTIAIMGCKISDTVCDPCPVDDLTPSFGNPSYLNLEDACIEECPDDQVMEFVSPLTLEDFSNVSYLDLSLDQCIEMALKNNRIMRDLGGTLLRTPSNLATVNDAAIVYNDPQFGEEAALSAFDANFFANAQFQKNDRATNNLFVGNRGQLRQDFHDYRWGISKQSVTGSVFNFNHVINYDRNNQVGNVFHTPGSSWDTFMEAQVRVPLLQGGGVLFNRIAGPNNPVGVNNGILVARTNTEISLARFRQGVRDLLSNVENAYWDLHFAYRELETLIDARNKALVIWQRNEGGVGQVSDRQDVAQAAEQYFRFESQIIDALSGRPVDGTRTNNGSAAGTFRGSGGVRLAERRLRLILGLPLSEKVNGCDLIKPADAPSEAPIQYDWATSVQEAESNRPELVQRRWEIKRDELELIAAKKNLLPRLDVAALYRFRGFGKSLTGGYNPYSDDVASNNMPITSNAFADLVSGDHQEWQLESNFNVPVGLRRAHAATRTSELRLARSRAIYREQKRDVMFALNTAFVELKRAFDAKLAALDRYTAAETLLSAAEEKVRKRGVSVNVLLEAQRRVAESKIQFYRAQIDYMLAIKSIQFEKGTMLDWMNVRLDEAQSSPKALRDANQLAESRRGEMSYVIRDQVISRGPQQNSALQSNPLTFDMAPGIPAVESMSLPQGAPSNSVAPPPGQTPPTGQTSQTGKLPWETGIQNNQRIGAASPELTKQGSYLISDAAGSQQKQEILSPIQFTRSNEQASSPRVNLTDQ